MLWQETKTNGCAVACGVVLISALAVSCASGAANDSGAEQKEAVFENWPLTVEVQHRPGTYWWVPASAWDKDNIDWNLQKLKEGGIGTAHIVAIYGARGYEDRTIEFLSDEWVENLKYILKKAKQLGMQVDMTTGCGWCFGGPDLAPEHQSTVAVLNTNTNTLEARRHRHVKRAAPGGGGHMLDPFSPNAMKEYLKRFDKALSGLDLLPRAQYHDSYEYDATWSPEIPVAFEKRRGYDMNEHLDVLFGKAEIDETASRIRYDYRLTAAELHQEYIQVWADWAASKGMQTRDQAHNSPSNFLDTYATATIAETEMYGATNVPIPGFRFEERFTRGPVVTFGDSGIWFRMPSSAAHVAHEQGKQLVSSESCTWMREHWHGTLGQIKVQMDQFFLYGINHVFFHGSCYSPKDVPWPGWFFYASTQVNWRNSIYHDLPILNAYIARCQSVLQSGGPANDIIVYWPVHDVWMGDGPLIHATSTRNVHKIGNLLDSTGYTFDFASDKMLDTIQYKNGKLVAPGGTYKVIVVPECKYLPGSTAERLADLAADGATIIFETTMPSDVPGLGHLKDRRADFAKASARLRNSAIVGDIPAELVKAGLEREKWTDHGLRFIRRKIDGEYWYFIANQTAKDYSDWLELTAECRSAILYDPMTGDASTLPSRDGKFYLDIAAGQSLIVHASRKKCDVEPYVPTKASGEKITLEGTWQIEFIDGGPALPETYSTDSLSSWTDAPDDKAKAFAGTARYTLTFTLSDVSADDYMLDLGDVRESARVKINGTEVAKLVALPMRSKVGPYLKKGANTIEIEVTNLTANRIRDLDRRKVEWKIMGNANIHGIKSSNFAGWPLQPSGLLGPVTLSPLSRIRP